MPCITGNAFPTAKGIELLPFCVGEPEHSAPSQRNEILWLKAARRKKKEVQGRAVALDGLQVNREEPGISSTKAGLGPQDMEKQRGEGETQ